VRHMFSCGTSLMSAREMSDRRLLKTHHANHECDGNQESCPQRPSHESRKPRRCVWHKRTQFTP
jgi:hypothetical protein